MEIKYKQKKYIICPQIICIFFICIYISLILYLYIKYNTNIHYIFFIPVIVYTFCFYFINKGIIDKNYNNFIFGIMISLFYAIICSGLKVLFYFVYFVYFLISIIFFFESIDDDDIDNLNRKKKKSKDDLSLGNICLIILATIFIDFIFSAFLFPFKNNVKKFCENQNDGQNIFTNAPLIE